MLSKIVDFVLLVLKWPIALLMATFIPSLIFSYKFFDFYTFKFAMLGIGIAFYVFILLTAGRNICFSMQIISHELTHVLFALLTFHSVGRVRLNPDDSGGSMVLKGRGNWLITLAPYFFPLFAFFYMLLMPWLLRTTGGNWLVYVIFGYFIAYYWATVLSQVHPKQTDIIKEGYIFSAILIVAGNLYVTGLLFAFNGHLWSGFIKYSDKVWHHWLEFIPLISNLVRQYM